LQKVLSYTSPHDPVAGAQEITDASPSCPTCGVRKATDKGVTIHRVRAHGYRIPQRQVVDTVFCPACLDEFATVQGSRLHYQKRRCWEAQVEDAAEAIDEGEACLDAPWYAFTGVIFPRSLSTLKGHILHWEVAAAADFVIAMALWSGPTGIVLSRLLYEHIRCMRSDGMTETVLKRHERFLCAVIDSMYVHQVVSCEAGTVDQVGNIRLIPLTAATTGHCIWNHLRGFMDGTWYQTCYERITAADWNAEITHESPVFARLCRRVASTPRPYHEDSVTT
jgi:hypothetical protein